MKKGLARLKPQPFALTFVKVMVMTTTAVITTKAIVTILAEIPILTI